MSNYSSNTSGNGSEQFDDNSPFSISDLLTLPESEQKLLKWIIKQGDVSFAAAIDYMKQENEIVSNMLNNLCNLGFLESFYIEGEKHFRCHLLRRKSIDIPENIWRNLDF